MTLRFHLVVAASLGLVGCGGLASSSPLIDAIKARDAAAVEKLLDEGADVNASVRDGTTPLIAAAAVADEALMARLLDAGAAIGAKDAAGKSAIMYAAYHGDFADVRLLLDRGASVDELKSVSGFAPLLQPCFTGEANLEELRYYLSKGFAVDVRGKDGETAVHCAARHGLVDYLAFLVAEKAPVDVADAAGQTPLHRAAGGAGADLAFVKALVAAGASPAATDKAGKTPADLVNTAQHQDIADFLRAAAAGTP